MCGPNTHEGLQFRTWYTSLGVCGGRGVDYDSPNGMDSTLDRWDSIVDRVAGIKGMKHVVGFNNGVPLSESTNDNAATRQLSMVLDYISNFLWTTGGSELVGGVREGAEGYLGGGAAMRRCLWLRHLDEFGRRESGC